ncbi:hypothetical protein Clacol_010236 [Clathrus columnatus]|uniref:Uncharacterized protein n=1 Tax=Clathrus columnatus TaxID=1419009 RepID=A0AAV5AQB6_9AGAM|nr:hypothetical protein Clacol_010236 [Clathrus columnatus]
MTSIHPIHLPDPVYGQPEIHIPDEINGFDDDVDAEYDSFMGDTKGDARPEDWLLPDEVFEHLTLESNGIRPTPQHPHEEPISVLLPIPRSAIEEKELFENVMTSLRKRVTELEEEELFESAMRNFTHRSTTAMDPTGNIVTITGNTALGMGEPNSAGFGEQPRSVDVKELLRSEIRQTRARERARKEREA